MEFHERIGLRPVLWAHLLGLTGTAFESFFQDLLGLVDPSFVPVRTHGNIGDQGSDGLSLSGGKLYACYAPEVPNAASTVKKFKSDLASALVQRARQFHTFVFVHNDVRGVHPELATALAEARTDYQSLKFEVMGQPRIRDMVGRLDRPTAESLLGTPLPLAHESRVGLVELEELLGQLRESRLEAADLPHVESVSSKKLLYSELTADTQAELRDAMKYSPSIEGYYNERIDVMERDEVAARFRNEYAEVRVASDDPEVVLQRLQIFLAGEGPLMGGLRIVPRQPSLRTFFRLVTFLRIHRQIGVFLR